MRSASLVALCILMLVPVSAGQEKRQTSKPLLRAVGYYIAVRASFNHSELINLFGASNLPPGSILGVNIYDFLGEGSKIFNDKTNVVVGKDGLFHADIRPKKGEVFRHNMICDVVFMPTYPGQPASVLKVVGKAGEHLGDPFAYTNPQLDGNPRVTILADTTVVH